MRRAVLILFAVCDGYAQTNTTITFTGKHGEVIKGATVVRFDATKLVYRVDMAGGTVLLSDLPADLQERFGYHPPKPVQPEPAPLSPETNAVAPRNPPGPPADDPLKAARGMPASAVAPFLAKHADSLMLACRFEPGSGCFIAVSPDHFTLVINEGVAGDWKVELAWCFRFDEEAAVREMFQKVIEWGAVALTNKAVDFTKPVARFGGSVPHTYDPNERAFSFVWNSGGSEASLWGAAGHCDLKSVRAFQGLLNAIPALKDELVEKIRKKEEQESLFR